MVNIDSDFNIYDILHPYQHIIDEWKQKMYDTQENVCRYRSIQQSMIVLLSILIDHEQKNKLNYNGMTYEEIITQMKDFYPTLEIQSLITRLYRLKFIEKILIPKKQVMYIYYRINKDRFLCYKGIYLLHHPDLSLSQIGFCPYSMICLCDAKSCKLLSKTNELLKANFGISKNIIENSSMNVYYQNKFIEWRNDEIHNDMQKNTLLQWFKPYKSLLKMIKQMFSFEITYYYHKINSIFENTMITEKERQKQFELILLSLNKNVKPLQFYSKYTFSSSLSNNNEDNFLSSVYECDKIDDENYYNTSMNIILQSLNHIKNYYAMQNKLFEGMSSYKIESLLIDLPSLKEVTNDTIHKLVRNNFLSQRSISQKRKNLKNHYYDMEYRFPCHCGTVVLNIPKQNNIYSFVCPNRNTCNYSASSCQLLSILLNKIESYIYPHQWTLTEKNSLIESNKILTYYQNQMQNWIADENKLNEYYEIVSLYLNSINKPKEHSDVKNIKFNISLFSNQEIIYYGKLIPLLSEKEKIELKTDLNRLIRVSNSKKTNKTSIKKCKFNEKTINSLRKDFIDIIMNTPTYSKKY